MSEIQTSPDFSHSKTVWILDTSLDHFIKKVKLSAEICTSICLDLGQIWILNVQFLDIYCTVHVWNLNFWNLKLSEIRSLASSDWRHPENQTMSEIWAVWKLNIFEGLKYMLNQISDNYCTVLVKRRDRSTMDDLVDNKNRKKMLKSLKSTCVVPIFLYLKELLISILAG